MDFPVEYFRPEVRDGFYVDGMMKRAWAEQIQVLTEVFDKVCKKYNISYFAHGGTLLGAVRHHGFIPWDDDIDVIMLRDDYMRFREIMLDAFPSEYEVLAYDTHGKFETNNDTIIRVINIGDVNISDQFLKENCQFPYPLGIDVFPIDFLPDDPAEREAYKSICGALYYEVSLLDRLDDKDDPEIQEIKAKVTELTGYKYRDDISSKIQTFRLLEAVSNMYHRDECSQVAMTSYWVEDRLHLYQTEWFLNPKKLPFENIEMPVCGDPEGELRQEYGNDFMVQNRNFPAHDYPFYEVAEQKFIDYIGRDPFYYHYTQEGIEAMQRETGNESTGVLFVVPMAEDWKYLEFYYKKAKEDGKEVTVLPIPYYDCGLLKDAYQMNFEGTDFPEDLPLADYRTVDIGAMHPDEIVISFPYDQYNYTVMIDEKYFASTLKDQTDKLVYISPIETDDTQAMSQRDQIAMKHYVMVPGVVLADEVYVQSEAMKQAYIARLKTSFNDDCVNDTCLKNKMTEDRISEIFEEKIKKRD